MDELALKVLGKVAAPFAESIDMVGSRVTCSPAPVGTDQDYLVFVTEDNWGNLWDSLVKQGWSVGGSLPVNHEPWDPTVRFTSFKRGEDNIICTDASYFHKRFMAATSIAKRFNLLEKPDRIALFQAVLYANSVQP